MNWELALHTVSAQELRERRSGRPGPPVLVVHAAAAADDDDDDDEVMLNVLRCQLTY